MGMFDDVIVECDLPGPPVADRRFQSKDFGCHLDLLTITREGRLLITTWRLVDAPKREFIKLTGEQDPPRDLNYHGMFNFYKGADRFNAKFTDGQLVSIERVEITAAESAAKGGDDG